MKQKILFALVLSLATLSVSARGVVADTYGQANCTSTYGQTGCYLGTTTEASKSAVYLANTALDTPTLMAVGGLMVSGVAALALKKKIA